MKNPFLRIDNPILRRKTQEIPQDKIASKQTQNIIDKMLKIAYGEQKDSKKPIMVGLAAPQIGIMKRIILVDIKANGKGRIGELRVYINPEINWASKKQNDWYEGCYSTGKICGIVSRPISIKIHAITVTHSMWNTKLTMQPSRLQAKFIKEKHKGYIARIFQHEIDHLNGILFIDHIKDPDKLHCVEDHEFPLYRNKQAWRTWPRKYRL